LQPQTENYKSKQLKHLTSNEFIKLENLISLENFFNINKIKDVAILFINEDNIKIDILKSINFSKVIIRSICIVNNSKTISKPKDIRIFLKENGYSFYSRKINSNDIYLHESVKNGLNTVF
jgi:hypothetical protein